ncbi:NADP-dependent oxidoreductase [Usitatibacter palustris]|uniref:NADP-dependent oxidoreductase YfmJ n=1 Tax=Usitatibacter palustris TaxID=2732487 RepID=A0A6M4H3S3_9PROT|nr:NADP-dependent oxidoreductase [Usitatibacter palustris]QJR13932.1 Putative NADP-dependent oxidoreductase YfmJ [Usitatibacter palustris]
MNNRQIRLAARPVGVPKPSDWKFIDEPVGEPADGEVLVKVLYLSLDPAMRGWMNEGKSYIRPVAIDEVMRAGGVGVVVASKSDRFKVGDHVVGTLNVQTHALVPEKALTRIDPRLAPLPVYLSVLGMPGMTAYFGLLDVGQPKEGNTVVVSGAAGAVGAVVGQIAKIKGCRVVGIAGGADKCRYVVEELGFDAAIDYKTDDVKKALRATCEKGIDVYFDNVGGDILDAALAHLAFKARVVICGAISQYNNTTPIVGPANYLSLLVNRARMEGMIVFDYADRYAEAAREMAGWMQAGKLKSREDVVDGLDTFPDRLLMLFKGENQGKLVLRVASA